MLILLKFHRCFGPCLKMCLWFGYNPQITCIFIPLVQIELRHFSGVVTIKSEYIVGTLCAQLLLQSVGHVIIGNLKIIPDSRI